MSVIYGTLYMCFAAFPFVFQEGRGWIAGIGGLVFIGVLIGVISGVVFVIWDNKRFVHWHRKTGGFAPAEVRVLPVIGSGVCIVAGLAWFAATNGPGVHCIVSIIACVPFGFGLLLVLMCCLNYL